jgi:hypothetical protein
VFSLIFKAKMTFDSRFAQIIENDTRVVRFELGEGKNQGEHPQGFQEK